MDSYYFLQSISNYGAVQPLQSGEIFIDLISAIL